MSLNPQIVGKKDKYSKAGSTRGKSEHVGH